mmetsp:Transcript_4129/g.18565  ORF Transcript_4129/g.18565 Transcript_4129/m.18565 type:complete len:327 (-) Transcript_4129:1358-2338(-)
MSLARVTLKTRAASSPVRIPITRPNQRHRRLLHRAEVLAALARPSQRLDADVELRVAVAILLLLVLLLVETATVRVAAQRAHHHPLVVHRPLARQRALLDVRPEPVVAVERAREEPGSHPQPFFSFGFGRLLRLCLSRLFLGFGASRGSDRGIADHGVDDRAQEPAPRPLRIPHLRPGGRVHSKVKVVVPLRVERRANRLCSVRLILAAVPALDPFNRPDPRAEGADHVRVARTPNIRRLDVSRSHHPRAQLRLAPVLPEAHQVQIACDAPVLGVHAPLVFDGRRAAVALASLGQRRQRQHQLSERVVRGNEVFVVQFEEQRARVP